MVGEKTKKEYILEGVKNAVEYDFWHNPTDQFLESVDEAVGSPNSSAFHYGRGFEAAKRGLDYSEAQEIFSDWDDWDKKGYQAIDDVKEEVGDLRDTADDSEFISELADRILLEEEQEKIQELKGKG